MPEAATSLHICLTKSSSSCKKNLCGHNPTEAVHSFNILQKVLQGSGRGDARGPFTHIFSKSNLFPSQLCVGVKKQTNRKDSLYLRREERFPLTACHTHKTMIINEERKRQGETLLNLRPRPFSIFQSRRRSCRQSGISGAWSGRRPPAALRYSARIPPSPPQPLLWLQGH